MNVAEYASFCAHIIESRIQKYRPYWDAELLYMNFDFPDAEEFKEEFYNFALVHMDMIEPSVQDLDCFKQFIQVCYAVVYIQDAWADVFTVRDFMSRHCVVHNPDVHLE